MPGSSMAKWSPAVNAPSLRHRAIGTIGDVNVNTAYESEQCSCKNKKGRETFGVSLPHPAPPHHIRRYTMPQVKPIAKIHCAATYFVFVSRDINEIAETFDTSDRTIRRWAEDEEWETALDACGYTGDRNFETQPYRDTERDAGGLFEKSARGLHCRDEIWGTETQTCDDRCGSRPFTTPSRSRLGDETRLARDRRLADGFRQSFLLMANTPDGWTGRGS